MSEEGSPKTWAHVIDERRSFIEAVKTRRNDLESYCEDLADSIEVKAKTGLSAKKLLQIHAQIKASEYEIEALNELLFVYRDATVFIPDESED